VHLVGYFITKFFMMQGLMNKKTVDYLFIEHHSAPTSRVKFQVKVRVPAVEFRKILESYSNCDSTVVYVGFVN
jgi:hypothetical protein